MPPAGVSVTLPDAGGRYLTVMVMDEDGYVVRVFHDPGVQQLAADEVGGGFAVLVARILVDPDGPRGRGRGQPAPGPPGRRRRIGPSVDDRAVRRCQLPGDQEAAAGARAGPARLARDLRHQGRRSTRCGS